MKCLVALLVAFGLCHPALAELTAEKRAVAEYAITHGGDKAKGKLLFADAKRTRCLSCHQVGAEGGQVGPQLSAIGGKFDRPHLIESLLEPSQQIVEGYRTTVLRLADGQVLAGIVRDESETELTLWNAQGERRRLPKRDIEAREVSPISTMPDGLTKELSADEFTDLIAYLETLRTGGAKFGGGVTGPVELPAGFTIRTVATGLTGAVALEVARDGRIFACEQTGTLRVIKCGELLSEPFVTLPVEANWERGLIGVTVHPQFPETPYLYVCYVAAEPYPHHVISRFTAQGDVAVPGSELRLLEGDDQSKLGGKRPDGHQGGSLHFGPDGTLFIAIGEQTAEAPAQNRASLLGKLLRIQADGSIPEDNPFARAMKGKYRSVWVYGLRNPFTFAIEPKTGLLLINDVGGKSEEINIGGAGNNYGWPTIDHGPTTDPRFTGPIHIYPQASISGGAFVPQDSPWPAEYRGQYLFADFVHGWIRRLPLDGELAGLRDALPFASGLRRPVDLRFGPEGQLYVLLRNAWVIDGKFEGGTSSLLSIQWREQ